jgi:hypothetical protein
MAQRLSCLLFAASILLLAGEHCDAQPATLPKIPMPPSIEDSRVFPEPASAGKELPAKEVGNRHVDDLIETTFGKHSAERKRPIRLWLPKVGMVIAAEKVTFARGGLAVRFSVASAGFESLDGKTLEAEFRHLVSADEIVIVVDQSLQSVGELLGRRVDLIDVVTKNSIMRITPEASTAKALGGAKIGVAPQPPPVASSAVTPAGGGKFTELVDPKPPLEVRFKFRIDKKASLTDLLPTPAKASAKLPLWTNEDLAKVSELTFGEPISKELPKHKAMKTTAHVMAKINHLNAKKTDGFMLAMLEQRSDLRGLPFLMGDECRTRAEQAKIFASMADAIREVLALSTIEKKQAIA